MTQASASFSPSRKEYPLPLVHFHIINLIIRNAASPDHTKLYRQRISASAGLRQRLITSLLMRWTALRVMRLCREHFNLRSHIPQSLCPQIPPVFTNMVQKLAFLRFCDRTHSRQSLLSTFTNQRTFCAVVRSIILEAVKRNGSIEPSGNKQQRPIKSGFTEGSINFS